MARKKKAPPAPEAGTTTAVLEPPAVAVAEETPAVTAVAEPPVAAELPQQPETSFADRVGQSTTNRQIVDPFKIAADYEAGVHLSERKKLRVMVIKFDERPAQAVIERVKTAGFRWNQTDAEWRRLIDWESPMTSRIDAERLYQEVRQMVRSDKGMSPAREFNV